MLGAGDGQLANSFMAILISIIAHRSNRRNVIRAIRVLHKYLTNDQDCFRNFKPNKPLLTKMNLGEIILSQSTEENEAALELSCFIMRYHRSIDYQDFSESPYAV